MARVFETANEPEWLDHALGLALVRQGQMEAALVVIVLMWLFIALSIKSFAKLSRTAAFFLVPYLVWVSYATYLNAGYAALN